LGARGFQRWLTSRVSWWREQCLPLLLARGRQVVDHQLQRCIGSAHRQVVPAIWTASRGTGVTDHAGTLRVIDFEHARIDLQARELVWHQAIGVYDRITWGFVRYILGYRRSMAPQVRVLITGTQPRPR
jgi:hypothetical protein